MDLLFAILLWSPFGVSTPNMSQLPPLMVQTSGKPVSNLAEWKQRREAIKFQLQYLVYGFLPRANPPMTIKILDEVPLKNGAGTFRDVRLQFPTLKKEIKLAVFISKKNSSQSDTFLVLNKCGNQTVLNDPAIPESGQEWLHSIHCYINKVKLGRGSAEAQYPVTEILNRGHNFVTFAESDMAADSSLHEGVGVKGAMSPTFKDKKRSWGVLMAWAWGYMRAMDYLEDAKGINPQRVIAVGHSRRGKAALLAAAYDERFPAVIPHQSGTGGTALMRGSEKRETPHMMTNGWIGYSFIQEPDGLKHFFAPVFNKISENVDALPFDSHFLIALVAPRLLIDFQGKDDAWAGPESATVALQAAAPAWTLMAGNHANLSQVFVAGGHRFNDIHWKLMMDIVELRMPAAPISQKQ
jgi:pimeloyl-ACP methyl ester carboxylesterase